MSRVGKNPIQIPKNVDVSISGSSQEGQIIRVKGVKGELESLFRNEITVTKEDGKIFLKRSNDEKLTKSLHGMTRSMIQNMIIGVTEGFRKELDIAGIGYRAQLQGNKLVLQLGYSHQLEVDPPTKETKIEVDKNQTHLTISGIDKKIVGDLAAHIRSLKLPEPYKGKGVKYSDERIRRKVGKSAVKK